MTVLAAEAIDHTGQVLVVRPRRRRGYTPGDAPSCGSWDVGPSASTR